MKLLKGIIKAVFILIFVLVVAVVVFLLVISDNSTPDYKPSEDLTTLDGLLGKGIYESLDKIALIQKEDRPTSENNKIDFSRSIILATRLNNGSIKCIRNNNK